MANYELMLIVNSSLTEDERNNSIWELKSLFEKNSVHIENEDVWWDKKLAYKIKGSERGFYYLYDLNMDGKLIKDLNKTINLDKNIWRYMFVNKNT